MTMKEFLADAASAVPTNSSAQAGRDLPEPPADPVALAAAAAMFKSLSDPTRLAIVQHLALGEHRVVDLTAHLGLAQSTVSAHLACLKDCDLITSRPQGRASMFSLKHPELLLLLSAAEQVLAATGAAVTLCPAATTLASTTSEQEASK